MDVDAEQVRALPSGRLSRFLSKRAGAVRRAVQSPRVSIHGGPDVEQVGSSAALALLGPLNMCCISWS